MPRDYAQILVRVWADPSWRARPLAEQHLYFLLVSQPQVNLAGVLPLQPRKWASCSADGGTAVDAALAGLRRSHYLVVDEDTEEVLIRTFVRNTGLFRTPGMLKAALVDAEAVQSPVLRSVLAQELGRLPALEGKTAAEMTARIGATRALLEATGKPIPDAIPDAVKNPSRMGSETVSKQPIPDATPEGMTDRSITSTGTYLPAVGTMNDLERGNVQEVDARADDVPDARPAPSKITPSTDAPPAPVHENAMPPARCRNHLELADPPPCGRCADARRAQEAWIADRDAKVAAGKAAIAAEHDATEQARRAAIDACRYCDDRGMTPHGVRCGHTEADEVKGPGKAAFEMERAKLRERAAAKAKTTAGDGKSATGDQLGKLAILFGEAGVNDRDNRLMVIGEAIGRPIATTRELTRAEASVLIDRLEHPLPPEPEDEGIPSNAESDGPADLAAQAEDDLPPDDPDDAVEDEYQADQATWATEDDGPVYSYAGGPDDPPF